MRRSVSEEGPRPLTRQAPTTPPSRAPGPVSGLEHQLICLQRAEEETPLTFLLRFFLGAPPSILNELQSAEPR